MTKSTKNIVSCTTRPCKDCGKIIDLIMYRPRCIHCYRIRLETHPNLYRKSFSLVDDRSDEICEPPSSPFHVQSV